MILNLVTARKLTGFGQTAIKDAIASGELKGSRHPLSGTWQIDSRDLARWGMKQCDEHPKDALQVFRSLLAYMASDENPAGLDVEDQEIRRLVAKGEQADALATEIGRL